MSRLGPELTLEQIDDWFKIGKKSTKPKVQSVARSKLGGRWLDPKTGGALVTKDEQYVPPYKRNSRDPRVQQNYADYYKQMESETQVSELPGASKQATASMLESLEVDTMTSGTAPTMDEFHIDKSNHVYSNYNFIPKRDSKLPIAQHRDQIVTTIESNQVTVIQGSTGSGKTTQVPQYILDSYAAQNRYCNIIVTQPRRIAAMSISRRVCQERGWNLGTVCGYQVGMNREFSEDTRLLYVTTGILLQKLINTKHMFDYTHVILDEVHERDQDTDFSLLVVRKLLRTNSRQVKVVLMSATIESQLFARYFSVPILGRLEQAPVINVEGKCFTVSEYYVEDLKPLGPLPGLDVNEPSIQSESENLAKQLILKFDAMEIAEQGRQHADHPYAPNRGTVLVFLPGLREIQNLDEALHDAKVKHNLRVHPLHSSITKEEQARVFIPPEEGQRKIILSTNIAESSITVPDIKYVIDFCLTRNLVCDVETNYTSLQVEWASKANCTQRKGRAGRVSNGRVYRMVTRQFWARHINDYGIPEMQRCPLEQLILHVKLLDLGEPKAILGLALSPPNLDDIEKTILLLKEVGALATLKSGAVNPHDGELTFIGQALAKLPVDVRIGKLLVLGHVFGVLEECLTIAAALSRQSFHARPYKKEFEAYRHKMTWARGSFSDCFASLHAYQVWEHNKERFLSYKELDKWCHSSFIQHRRIRDVEEVRKELAGRLEGLNIKTPRRPPNYHHRLSYERLELVLKIVLAGAFYPNFFVQGELDEETAARTMSGKDAFTTVMVKNLPANHGALYKTAVENLFTCCGSRPQAHFEETRAYIEFKQTAREVTKTLEIRQLRILLSVYMAIKMRQLRLPLLIEQLDADDAREKLEQLSLTQDSQSKANHRLRTNRIKAVSDLERERSGCRLRQVDLPHESKVSAKLFASVMLDCGHFWAQYADTMDTLNQLQEIITFLVQNRSFQRLEGRILPGMICMAPFKETHDEEFVYYRARVEEVPETKYHGREIIQVFFVDYGNYESVDRSLLLNFNLEDSARQHLTASYPELKLDILQIPFQAFECFLSGIKPSSTKCLGGNWSDEAKQFFAREVAGKELLAQIYSVVHGTVRVELTYVHPLAMRQVNVNQFLKEKGFADDAEETFASRQNHAVRQEEQRNPRRHTASVDWLEVPAEDVRASRRRGPKINIHGPSSPYEMSFYSMTNLGRLRAARVVQDSVNSVALNDEPQNPHARLMIAGHVKLNPAGNTMIAENTTILPYIPGLPALAAMLFAPTVELRTNSTKTHYIGALCGLGWDQETHGPALPDHDMEITFDTKLSGEEDKNEDIISINGVRMLINLALNTEKPLLEWPDETMLKIQENAQNKLLELILKRRQPIKPQNFNRPYRWNQIDPDDLLSHNLEGTEADSPKLLNLINAVFLKKTEREVNEEEVRAFKRRHAQLLQTMVLHNRSVQDVVCELCHVTLPDLGGLKMHLATQAHRSHELALL